MTLWCSNIVVEPTNITFAFYHRINLNKFDLKQVATLFKCLVKRPLALALFHSSRECLAIAAGYVCLLQVAHNKNCADTPPAGGYLWGLEACPIMMSRADYDKIIAGDRPGPNKNKQKAEHLRTFAVPARLIQDSSTTQTNRTINVFCAFVDNSIAIFIIDFVCLWAARIGSQHRNRASNLKARKTQSSNRKIQNAQETAHERKLSFSKWRNWRRGGS
ncbi:hypothetical protein CPB83DRAFT_899613 [Crepidotus variabilis]|uniref:Uncharacterized protein n=1 Tax=Crepidotus variabilis TaxID=179855 RepID=A0A9P6E4Q3_9AGAR|nr:hypothetical protein CPB83DRAFT_899613 [Crepidotus variabilis]